MRTKVLRPSIWYWDRLNKEDPTRVGTVVVLGWMLSKRRHLAPYTRFYRSCGWEALVCHPQVFNLFFPSYAATLALSILEELAEDLEKQPRPIVFAVFSGGHKACLYKILQILQGKCVEVKIDVGRYELVKRYLVGLVFDSSPVDFVSELGAKFVSHQVLTLEPGNPFTVVSWGARVVGKTLDFLFHRSFEPQRQDLWRTLYSTVNIGPILLLCSENDELAPIETIHHFASNLQELGGSVSFVSWETSEHVGHFRLHPEEYKIAVRKWLLEAEHLFCQRFQTILNDANAVSASMLNSQTDFDGPASSWAVLPETISAKIQRVSRLPHVNTKGKGKISKEAGAPVVNIQHQGFELQPHSEFQVGEWAAPSSGSGEKGDRKCESASCNQSFGLVKSHSSPMAKNCTLLQSKL